MKQLSLAVSLFPVHLCMLKNICFLFALPYKNTEDAIKVELRNLPQFVEWTTKQMPFIAFQMLQQSSCYLL